jgi:hypothetical protein
MKPPRDHASVSFLRTFARDPHRQDFGRSVNYILKGLRQTAPADADRLRLALTEAIATTLEAFARQMDAEKGGA